MPPIGSFVPQICSAAFNAALQPVSGAWNLFRPGNDAASSYSSRAPAAAALAATLGGCTSEEWAAAGAGVAILFIVARIRRHFYDRGLQVKNDVEASKFEEKFKRMIEDGRYQTAYESVGFGDDRDYVLRLKDPDTFVGKDIIFAMYETEYSACDFESRIVRGRCVRVERKDNGVYLVIETVPEFVRQSVRLSVNGDEVPGFDDEEDDEAEDYISDHRTSTVYFRDAV